MDNSLLQFCSNSAYVTALIAAAVLFLAAFTLLLFRREIISDNGTEEGKNETEIYREILHRNEKSANIFFAKVLLAVVAILVMIAVANETGFLPVADRKVFSLVLACIISATATSALLTVLNGGESHLAKCMLIFAYILSNFLICILLSQNYFILLIFPVIVSIRYCDKRFSLKTTAACAMASIISRPAAVVYGIYNGFYDIFDVKVEPGTKLTFSSSVISTYIENGIVDTKHLVLYELSSMIAVTVLIVFAGLCVASIAGVGKKMITDGAVLTEEKNKAEIEKEEARARIMMSQLQPHFLYNSLSAIMAIDDNPPETVEALADFSKYLRANLNSLTSSELIPFAAEEEHVERYLSLEKLRFGERVNVVYDIGVTDFMIPPLSVQMAVENAVKHGITQRAEGGTVKLTTKELDGEIVIIVEDDGVGFDTGRDFAAEGGHVGLTSGIERVKRLTGGFTEIKSTIGVGTVVTIHIPREKKQ